MSRKLRPEQVDRLLRDALGVDLGAQDQDRLSGALREAWTAARIVGVRTETRVAARLAPPAAWAWIEGRLLTSAALAVVALGVGLHLSLPPRLVADSLLRQQATARVARQLRSVVAMGCVLEAVDDHGRSYRYRIEWRAPDQLRVRVESPQGVSAVNGVVPRAAVGLLGADSTAGADVSLAPSLRAARDFLAPDRVAALLEGPWEAAPGTATDGTATDFRVNRPGGRGVLRVTIDPLTDLPVRIEDGVRASFEWERGADARPTLGGFAASAGE